MRHKVVTYENNGVAKIADYSGSEKTEREIYTLIHSNSYRENLVKFLKEFNNGKPLDELSTASLGYALERLVRAKIFSTVDKIEFHNKPLSQFAGTKF
jgi:hypothetical protein